MPGCRVLHAWGGRAAGRHVTARRSAPTMAAADLVVHPVGGTRLAAGDPGQFHRRAALENGQDDNGAHGPLCHHLRAAERDGRCVGRPSGLAH
jgi:hypothetical protein